MTTLSLEQRVAHLEAELTQLKQQLAQPPANAHPWWNNVFGVFADCSAFDQMEQFGKEWRATQPNEVE